MPGQRTYAKEEERWDGHSTLDREGCSTVGYRPSLSRIMATLQYPAIRQKDVAGSRLHNDPLENALENRRSRRALLLTFVEVSRVKFVAVELVLVLDAR